ncbi:outer membrane protein assembly factor BamB [Thiocystis violacea]|nr:outer membrane protein assembly factor BamB [Thiocystis violacea]MBK1717269.1 outer membrane protein assembly factor BamB [Thiocystis violacea]
MGLQLRSLPARLGLMLLATQLAGCGSIPWFGKEKDPTPPSELPAISQEAALSTLWSQRPTRGTEGRRLYLVPAIAAGQLYVADARGRLVALAADSGRVLWQRETSLAFSGGPDVLGDRLVLGTSQGELVAFSTRDGQELWRAQLGSEVLSVPRLTADGKVMVHTLDDSLHGLEAATGKVLWRVAYPPPVLTLRGSSTPTLAESGVVVGLSGGKLVKVDPNDGTAIWEVVVTRPSGRSELARIADIDADPVLIGDTLYVGSYNGDLAAVDLASGEVRWRRELSAHAGIAADESGLFVTDSEDILWAANATDGAGRWKQEQLRYRRLTAPALIGNRILVGDLEGYLHLLDKSDGRLIGRARVAKSGITARPLVVGARLYVHAEDGTLAALTLGATTPATTARPDSRNRREATTAVSDEPASASTNPETPR